MSELDNQIDVEGYNNAEGDGGQAQMYAQAGQATAQLAQQVLANRAAKTAATGCQKPILNFGKKRKAYEDCLAKGQASQMPTSTIPPSPEEPKFFETTTGKVTIGVTVVVVLVGAYLGYKYLTKNK